MILNMGVERRAGLIQRFTQSFQPDWKGFRLDDGGSVKQPVRRARGLQKIAAAAGLGLALSPIAPSAFVQAADPNNCLDYAPPDVQVAQCWKVDTTVQTGTGLSIACVADDNPLGYYQSYDEAWGWSFAGQDGTLYTDHTSDGQELPFSILGTQDYITCGTGA